MKKQFFIIVVIGIIIIAIVVWFFVGRNTSTNQTCGGIAGIECPIGTTCILDDENISDSAGTCVEISAP